MARPQCDTPWVCIGLRVSVLRYRGVFNKLLCVSVTKKMLWSIKLLDFGDLFIFSYLSLSELTIKCVIIRA